ncbi:lysoplasmalogenase [Thermodesulfobacteriota bacterium]
MVNNLIILVGVVLLCLLLYFEKREGRKGLLIAKSTLSLLFVLTALLQPHPIPIYFTFILVGLILCLAGDIFLALPQEKMFLFGLISFLFGHIFYIIAFFTMGHISAWTLVASLGALFVSGSIFLWLKPHLGSMQIPVIFYIIVISVMIVGAWSLIDDLRYNWTGRVMVFVGALSFYFSDVFVARDRFMKNEFLNRLIGLPMYYFGQFVLAFSVGALRIDGV